MPVWSKNFLICSGLLQWNFWREYPMNTNLQKYTSQMKTKLELAHSDILLEYTQLSIMICILKHLVSEQKNERDCLTQKK